MRLFEQPVGALDQVPSSVGFAIELRAAPRTVRTLPSWITAFEDHGLGAVPAQSAPRWPRSVALVARDTVRPLARAAVLPRLMRRALSTGSMYYDSCAWPGLTTTLSGSPLRSVNRWTLAPKPPRHRPSAWSVGSPRWASTRPHGLRVFFPRASRGIVRANLRPVDAPQLLFDRTGRIELALQRPEQLIPQPVTRPLPEARLGGLPRAIALRQLAPRNGGVPREEHPIEDRPMMMTRPTTAF